MYCIKRFLFFFFRGEEGWKSCGRPVQETVSLKNTHTHTFSGCNPGVVELDPRFGRVGSEQPACDTHILHVYQRTTRVTSSCVREYVLWYMSATVTCLREREERTRLVESTISFFFFLSKSYEFSINAIYSCIIPSSTNNISFEKRNNRDSTVQTTISFLFPFLNIYNIVCRSCVLSLHSQNHVQLTVCVNVRSRFSLASPGGVYFEKTKK